VISLKTCLGLCLVPPVLILSHEINLCTIVTCSIDDGRCFYVVLCAVPKEPRVLTGRSLQCLARQVPVGINLAVRLDISESTITGMAFDALASGLQSAEITYRILMLWKRRSAAAGMGNGYRAGPDALNATMIDALTAAIEAVGYHNVAAIVRERHRENKELTPDIFQQTEVDLGLTNGIE